MAWTSFVALGDGFTEGMDDSYADGTYRGWADLVAARGADLRWAGQHLAPWIKQRLAGASSGDLVTAKRPELSPVKAIA